MICTPSCFIILFILRMPKDVNEKVKSKGKKRKHLIQFLLPYGVIH